MKPPGMANHLQQNRNPALDLWIVMPVVVCFVIPLIRPFGIIYLYDLMTTLAIYTLWKHRLLFLWWKRFSVTSFSKGLSLLTIGVSIGFVSAVVRAGLSFHVITNTIQYMLAIAFSGGLYSALLADRISLEALQRKIRRAIIVASGVGLIQFVLFFLDSNLSLDLYLSYLSLGYLGPATEARVHAFLERQYSVYESINMFRTTGLWDTSTTYAGMMTLGVVWATFGGAKSSLLLIPIVMLTLLTTQSRHSWVILVLYALGLVCEGFGARRIVSKGVATIAISIVIIGGMILMVLQSPTGNTLLDQTTMRLNRTLDQGFGDSSIELRYVEGTSRFVSSLISDPSIILFGFGVKTTKALEEGSDSGPLDPNQFGFVSNSWLLSIWVFGICGFLAFILLHWNLLSSGVAACAIVGVVSALIMLSDNYSIYTARCFFLIIAFLATGAAHAELSKAKHAVDTRLNRGPIDLTARDRLNHCDGTNSWG